MQDMVSWKDYDGVDGFGAASSEDVDNLNKALSAGSEQNPPASVVPGDGFALRVESLESTLKVTTYSMKHIRLWKNIPKLPAYNTVEEHNELSSYGVNSDSGFVAEGALPEEDDSSYERKHAFVKFMGTTRSVTHVMSVVKPAHGNVVAAETTHGTQHLLKMLERGLFFADSSLSAVQFDGYQKLMEDNSPAGNIIDLRGVPLSQDILDDACLTVHDAPNYGDPTDLYLNPKVHADLSKIFYPKERHDTFGATRDGMVGNAIRGFVSPAGDVMFQPDVFIDDGGGYNAATIGDTTKIPATPTISTGLTSPGATNPLFTADDAGDYFMWVVACNRYGKAAAKIVDASAHTLAAGDKLTFGVTPAGSIAVEWWEVYRTPKNGANTTARLVLRVANAAGTGETVIEEFNAKIPGTTHGFLFQQNLEAMSFKQLAPMVKIPLATIDPRIRWMQLIYGVPVLYAPGKAALIKNIGRAVGYVGAQ